MGVRQITTKEEWDTLLKEDKLVVVDFFATWCGPCKKIAPTIEGYSNDPEYADVIFAKIDVDELAEVAEECGISAMPTFHLYKGGKKVAEVVGASADKIKTAIKEHK